MNRARSTRQRLIRDLACCPQCRSRLQWTPEAAACGSCGKRFPVVKEVPRFTEFRTERTADADFQEEVMSGGTFTALLHNWGRKVLSSEYMPKDHVAAFLAEAAPGTVIVELGSGSRRLRDDVINVDLFAFDPVDLTADIAQLPFRSDAVDFIILDTVLEHVPEPHRIIAEIFRVLKPGGKVISVTPFIFPYHGYPKHYFNFTADGLDFLFRDFPERAVETNMGPTSALVNLVAEYFAVAFSGENKLLYTVVKGLALAPIFFFKYIDRLWQSSRRSTRIANHLCIIVRK